ncbi:MAG: xanthine dehydrogenase family protein molybdopterin-binding subunit [Acetobacteraceae bacterium]
MPRLEDARLLTGAARFIDDLPGPAWHAVFIRSPHAHARILGIETAAAGVPVVTAADLAGLSPLPCTAALPPAAGLIVPPRPALADGVVRHVGEAVAMAVAPTAEQARDAAERVTIHYDPLPAVTDPAAALRPDAPRLHASAPDNRAFTFRAGAPEAVAAAFAAAARMVTLELVNPRLIVCPAEPRGAIAEAADGRLHLSLSGASVHAIRDTLATIFALPAADVHVLAPEVGGGFGVKNATYPEYVALLWAARRFGRRLKWIAGRAEDFVSTAQGRDNRSTARLALDADGRFLALEVETLANLGAWAAGFGPGTATLAPATAMGGPYAIPAIAMTSHGVFTNTVPVDAYRGAGKPEANYVTERLVEAAARALGADPFALRRRNLVDRFPYRKALGTEIDSGDFHATLDAAEAAADRAGFPARRAAAAAAGRRRGMGVGCYLETARGQPDEAAALRFDPDGRIALLVGTQSTGMGHESAYTRLAARLLGLPEAAFRYVQADTDQVPTGGGHGGARSMHLGATAMQLAVGTLLERARPLAAALLQTTPDALAYRDGAFRAADGRAVTLPAIAAEPAHRGALDTRAENRCDRFTFPSGCHVAEVELDPETGALCLARYIAVDDFGTLLDATVTAGQVQGGLAQGIGQALFERSVYDQASGQLLSGSLMDYALPRAADLPALEVRLLERPSTANPLGVKGSGQAGAMIAPQVVMAAVLDALGGSGPEMPATPEAVWRALRGAGAAGGD